MATVLLGLFGNGMVDAFCCCQTSISLPHFGMEGEQLFVWENGMAHHNQTGPKSAWIFLNLRSCFVIAGHYVCQIKGRHWGQAEAERRRSGIVLSMGL